TNADITACMSDGNVFSGKLGNARGESSMSVDWQVYSPIKKEVVARISTSGDFKLPNTLPDGLAQLVGGAFTANAKALVANAEFGAAITAKPVTPQDVLLTEPQSKIALLGNSKAAKLPVADATGSVVTLLTGNASGSGVLLSDDGYILTNAHVVG